MLRSFHYTWSPHIDQRMRRAGWGMRVCVWCVGVSKSLVFNCFFIHHPQIANLILVFFSSTVKIISTQICMSSLIGNVAFIFWFCLPKFPQEWTLVSQFVHLRFPPFFLGLHSHWPCLSSLVAHGPQCGTIFLAFSLVLAQVSSVCFGEGIRANKMKCELNFCRPKKTTNVHSLGDRTLSQRLYKFWLGTCIFLCLW